MTHVLDVTILENPALPMLEVNAAYSAARSGQLLGQPILICSSHPEGSQLERYELAGTLVALEVLPVAPDSSIWVEQVAWTQAPQITKVWCDQNNASDWFDFVARELAQSLEMHPDLQAYLAYLGDDAVGMMIASSDGICGLWAGADDVARVLFARGANDLGRLWVSLPLERRGALALNSETARFNIWLRSHQPSDAQTKRLADP